MSNKSKKLDTIFEEVKNDIDNEEMDAAGGMSMQCWLWWIACNQNKINSCGGSLAPCDMFTRYCK